MKDNFSRKPDLYAKYRPTYPRELFDFITTQVSNKHTAWDCGTGNGQAAKDLASYFENVFATDISQKQLDNAYTADNIFYSVQPAEHTNFPENTFDLVTVSQALHWFKFNKFYDEVKRVAGPGAWLAVWTYSLLNISPEINQFIYEHHYNTLGAYWDKERKYVDDNYKSIPFPFAEIKTPVFIIHRQWTPEELEGYLNTWSALQKFRNANSFNPVDELMKKIRAFWKNEKMDIVFPVYLRMGRIEK
jgi:ubiquinone/menaquinone biosynthesis C-methylase UbiE